jgi:hypothetical protein
VPHVIAAFGGREAAERDRDEGVDLIEAPRPGRPEEGFQFGEGLFDRVEVGTVRRQKPELRADAFDRGVDLGLLVDDEVIEDHDVAGLQRGHEDLFDVGEETRIIDRAIEDGRRADPLEP